MASVNKSICHKCGTGNLIGSSFCCKCGSELKELLQKNPISESVKTHIIIPDASNKTSESKSDLKSISSIYDMKKNSLNSCNEYRRSVFAVFRCKDTSKEFSVKIEEMSSGTWSLTKAYPIDGGLKAYHEKLDIEGSFEIHDYSGCPYCGASGVLRCFCGRVFCWQVTKKAVKCPWCHENVIASGTFNNMKAGSDV